MKINWTNNHNSPDWEMDLVKNDDYTGNKGADWATSKLIDPGQMNRLKKFDFTHDMDVMESAFTEYGKAKHYIFERALARNPRYITKQRFFRKISSHGKGWTISGEPDIFDKKTGELWDLKNPTEWVIKNKKWKSWHEQLNIYAWLLAPEGAIVKTIKARAWVKDYKKYGPLGNPRLTIEFKLWAPEETERFIKDRITDQLEGQSCTLEQRWSEDKTAVWAVKKIVKKIVNKNAEKYGLHDTEQAAGRDALKRTIDKPGTSYHIEHRPANPWFRCEGYCVVKSICPQYKEGKK